eukprot:TRINITY_DN9043_c0_g1_i1.p1 TRINITY_DN9043_c0_g1~~TRINITY_DN9043_c0_g1_i1.p1  ORF type:complete len:719 (-),score=194.76 TRINITY_DN9043_c0_g1_i1:38-2149(-)
MSLKKFISLKSSRKSSRHTKQEIFDEAQEFDGIDFEVEEDPSLLKKIKKRKIHSVEVVDAVLDPKFDDEVDVLYSDDAEYEDDWDGLRSYTDGDADDYEGVVDSVYRVDDADVDIVNEVVEEDDVVDVEIVEVDDVDRKKKGKKKKNKKKGKKKEKKMPSITLISAVETLDQPVGYSSDDADFEMDFVGDYSFEDAEDEPDFKCLSPEGIMETQLSQTQRIAELLMLSETAAGNLLRHYRWETEALLSDFFENPDMVLKEVGLNDKTRSKRNKEYRLKGTHECSVCMDEYPAEECTALKCKHVFCNYCWEMYLEMKINEGEIQKIHCAAKDCKMFVPESTIKRLVREDVYLKYIRFITKSFVDDNSHTTWCPAPNCGNAITADMINGKTVECTCGYRFCFTCHQEAHAPLTCDQLAEWEKKCSGEDETGHWVGANTKDCPKCRVSVEKNGGCNHMTCRQCGYEWCWLCLRIWKGHNDYYSCSRYEKAQEKVKTSKKNKKYLFQKLEEEQMNKRKQLERYLEHFTKYEEFSNLASSDFADSIKEKMNAMQSHSTLAEVQFLERGAKVLMESYSLLKYCSVYKFFLYERKIEIEQKRQQRIEDEKLQSKKKKKTKSKKKSKPEEEEIFDTEPEVAPLIDDRELMIFIFTFEQLEEQAKILARALKEANATPDCRVEILRQTSLTADIQTNILSIVTEGLDLTEQN